MSIVVLITVVPNFCELRPPNSGFRSPTKMPWDTLADIDLQVAVGSAGDATIGWWHMSEDHVTTAEPSSWATDLATPASFTTARAGCSR